MSACWYYKSSAGVKGPVTAPELRQHAAAGTITADTPVRRSDTVQWVRASNVKGLLNTPATHAKSSAVLPDAIVLPTGKNAATSKNVFGKWAVKYNCPKCGLRLKSRIGEAGERDACPECGCAFTVPAKDKRNEVERLEAEQTQEKQQAAALRQAEKQAKKESKQRQRDEAATLQREQERKEKKLPRQPDFPQQEEPDVIRPAMIILCPYCRGEVHYGVQKCRHCGEFLVRTDHSDALAAGLGCLLGPVGLWYKGHFIAGFAWIAAWFLLVFATAGFGLLLAPFFWLGMAIHAGLAKGAR